MFKEKKYFPASNMEDLECFYVQIEPIHLNEEVYNNQ